MPSHHKELMPQPAWMEIDKSKEEKTSSQALDRKPAAVNPEVSVKQTPFARAVYDLGHKEKLVNDLTFGKRIGFYELRGEIGNGNFSQVKLGIHDLTNGERHRVLLYSVQNTSTSLQIFFYCEW